METAPSELPKGVTIDSCRADLLIGGRTACAEVTREDDQLVCAITLDGVRIGGGQFNDEGQDIGDLAREQLAAMRLIIETKIAAGSAGETFDAE